MAENQNQIITKMMLEMAPVLAKTSDVAEVERAVQNISKIAQDHPINTDPWIYRGAVAVLGLAVIAVVIGYIILLSGNPEINIPEALVAIGSASVGALAGLLTPIKSS